MSAMTFIDFFLQKQIQGVTWPHWALVQRHLTKILHWGRYLIFIYLQHHFDQIWLSTGVAGEVIWIFIGHDSYGSCQKKWKFLLTLKMQKIDGYKRMFRKVKWYTIFWITLSALISFILHYPSLLWWHCLPWLCDQWRCDDDQFWWHTGLM